MKIPVIINNRDLLTWPRAMVERISRYDYVGDIIIIDNGSTYQPLLEWYKTDPCQIVFTQNIGHKAPWELGIIDSLKSHYYVVTDSDLDLSQTPDDTLIYLQEKHIDIDLGISAYSFKIGLLLDIDRMTPDMLYYDYLQWYEVGRRNRSAIVHGVHMRVPVDTTFAIYPRTCRNYFVGGASVLPPYQAGHMPWYYTRETLAADPEYQYYLQHANASASIKSFLQDKQWVKESVL